MRSIFLSFLVTFSLVASAQTPPNEPALARDLQEEIVRIPVTVKDLFGREETRQIPITVFRPRGVGPFPVVVMNHGRPTPDKQAAMGRARFPHLSRYLVNKGFVVLVPTRVGYGENYGSFDPEESGPCNARRPEPMSTAASDQVLAAVAFAKTLSYADATRWVVMGVSVGGLTAVAAVYRNPPGLLGGVNFSGGSGGNPETSPGRPCSPQALTYLWKTKAPGATRPMLWLYWRNDKYWGEDIPKQWHQAWLAGGGLAEFHSLAEAGNDGHAGVGIDMEHWVPLVDSFLSQLGFTQPGVVAKPPPSAFAAVEDVNSVPTNKVNQEKWYPLFLQSKLPRAVALGKNGSFGYATGDWAVGKAMGFCQALRDDQCKLYAVDNDVVWVKE